MSSQESRGFSHERFKKGDIQMTQSEEIKYFKELGYTLDQISILVGINKEEVERVVKSASIRVR